MLFKGQMQDYGEDCQRAAQDPAELERINTVRKQRADEGLVFFDRAKVNNDAYLSGIQGAAEREAEAQDLDRTRQADAVESMRETVLSPGCDYAAYAEVLARKQVHIDLYRRARFETDAGPLQPHPDGSQAQGAGSHCHEAQRYGADRDTTGKWGHN